MGWGGVGGGVLHEKDGRGGALHEDDGGGGGVVLHEEDFLGGRGYLMRLSVRTVVRMSCS